MNTSWLAAAAGVICLFTAFPATAHESAEKVTPVLQQAVPNIPGKTLIAVMVDYPPEVGSPSHVHAKSAFIYGYVISGAIESQVNDGTKQILHTGESFYEPPGARHSVSKNASETQPAKFLAVFLVNTNDKVLTTPVQ